MAEPISIAASLAPLLKSAYQLTKAIYGTVDSIRNAPKHIQSVSSDTKAVFSVLGILASFLDDEEMAAGVVHPVIADDLREVLRNTISVLKELQLIVNEFVLVEQSRDDVGNWKKAKWTFKEAYIRQWREQLLAHKITLNVTVAMANLINTDQARMTTVRIEREVKDLKTKVTELLIKLDTISDVQHDQRIIVENYNSTMRRFARGADSIISSATMEPQPTPSGAISSIGVTEATESFHTLPPSVDIGVAASAKPGTFRTACSYIDTESFLTAPEHRRREAPGPTELNPIPIVGTSVATTDSKTTWTTQVFVKGPLLQTHAFLFEMPPTPQDILSKIRERDGVPEDFVSLRIGGRVISGHGHLDIPNNTTVYANINAVGLGWPVVDEEEDLFLANYLVPRRKGVLVKRSLPYRMQMHRERHPYDGSFVTSVTSVTWHDEHERRTQGRYTRALARMMKGVWDREGKNVTNSGSD